MVLVVAMLLSLTGTVTYAAEGSLTYTVGTASVDVSSGTTEVKVPVSLSNNTLGLVSAKFALEYDETALTFTGASAIVQDYTVTPNPSANTVVIDSLDNYTGNGEIFQLTFTVKDGAHNGDYKINIAGSGKNSSCYVGDDGMPVAITDANYVPGTITVSGVAAQPKVTSLKLMRTTTNDELTGKEFELTLYSISGSYSSSIRAEFEAEEGADTTVTWTISDENVATVENYVNTSTGKNFCKITPKGLGTATLTAHCGDLEASLQLTLAGPVATELKIKTSADKGYKTFYLHSTDTEAPT